MAQTRTALWIARRYLLARSHGYATFINWVSFAGLVLGVLILTVVLSIMNGFDREMTGRILSAVPHGFFEYDGDPPAADLQAIDGVSGAMRLFQGEAMAPTRYDGVAFVALAAVDVADAHRLPRLLSGQALENLVSTPGSLVLGAALAGDLRVDVGDTVRLMIPVATSAGVRARVERFSVAGTFTLRAQPDAVLAIARREDIIERGLDDAGLDGWRLQLDDPLDAPRLAERIRAVLGPGIVRFWTDDYGELFRAIKIEKGIMFALLALIVAIASLNIVSGQAMLVNDKRGDIAMLATMGASRRLIVGVFFLQGFSVAVLGVAVGLAIGIAVAANANAVVSFFEGLIGASVIEGTYFDRIHSHLVWPDVLAIVGVCLGLSLAAVLRPAFKAAAENPAEALHAS